MPSILKVVLLLGGLYLSFEGAHKILEKIFPKSEIKEVFNISEKDRIKGAVRTDLVLSAEIIVLANEAITGPFFNQLITLILVGLVNSMPYMMRGLGIIGTLAMLLVGGGIIAHTFHIPYFVPEILQNLALGLIAGLILVVPFEFFKRPTLK